MRVSQRLTLQFCIGFTITRITPEKYARMNLEAVRAGFELIKH